jgi:hypothetical protein
MKNKPYSMDADTSGIRERVAVTISGAIALGAQNESPAPEGHWLGEFWTFGRTADQWRSTVWSVARALNCLPSSYADANGHVLRAAEKLTAERDALRAACKNARDILATDRQGFVDCHQVHGSQVEDAVAHGLVWVAEDVWIPPDVADALRDYDRAIALIDAATAPATAEIPSPA